MNITLDAGKRLILIAVGHEIRQFIPQAKNFEYSDVVLTARRIQAFDIDPEKRLIYWSDTSLRTIMRAMIPDDPKQLGHPQDLEIRGLLKPSGVAVDWVAKYAVIDFILFFIVNL